METRWLQLGRACVCPCPLPKKGVKHLTSDAGIYCVWKRQCFLIHRDTQEFRLRLFKTGVRGECRGCAWDRRMEAGGLPGGPARSVRSLPPTRCLLRGTE